MTRQLLADREPTIPITTDPSRVTLVAAAVPMEQDGKPVPAGYTCRVYFFDDQTSDPVRVEGDITLNVAAVGPKAKEPKLIGVFPIPAERLAAHQRSDVLGTVYVFWLPCTAPPESNIHFECRFGKSGNGSEMAQGQIIGEAMLHPLSPTAKPTPVDNGPRYTIIEPRGEKNKPDVLTVETRGPVPGSADIPLSSAKTRNVDASAPSAVSKPGQMPSAH